MELNISLNDKLFWDEAVVVDIPFFPFQSYNKTEIKILDYVANRVLQIARDEKRIKYSEGDYNWLKDRHFTQSPSIVAIDTANITTENKTYLDYVFRISRVHPCILINCIVENDELISTRIHHDLKKEGYILPVFRRTPAADIVFTRQKFGGCFVDLLRGIHSSIPVENVPSLGTIFTEDDLKNRFPGIFIKNGMVFHRPKIVWIGVDSPEISSGLSFLFNSNMEYFGIEWFCNKFKINLEELLPYLKSGMLFGNGHNKRNIQFRLIKSRIYPKLMHALMHQFETKMIDADAIDTTHGAYPGYSTGEVVEYHSLGKLFDNKDTYSCKLLCYIRQCFSSKEYDKIILVDNGTENGLYELLPKIFNIRDNNIIRIVNFFNEPVLYPFDQLGIGGKAVIITDVINTGSFVNMVCKLLVKTRHEIQGIFSFIRNIKTPRTSLFRGISKSNTISVFTFMEKKLNAVDDVRFPDHVERFGINTNKFTRKNDSNDQNGDNLSNRESFLAFWNTVDKFCTIKREYKTIDSSFTLFDGTSKAMKSSWCHNFNLKKNSHENITEPYLFTLFLKNFFHNNDFDIIYVNDEYSNEPWARIICNFNSNDKIYHSEQELKSIENIDIVDNVLIVYTAMNAGRTIKETIQKVDKLLKNNVSYTCLTLFSRTNIIPETSQRSKEYLEQLLSDGVILNYFYLSSIPYYLTEPNNGFYKYSETYLQKLCN